MGKVIYPRKGEVHTAPVNYPAFAEATWAQVIEACQTNTVPATWVVGDQKAMAINGTDYLIDIIGKNHDDYADGSGKAPLTFQMHDCYGTSYAMNSGGHSNIGGWNNSVVRNTHLPSILALMPSEVKNSIKAVNKLTSAGNQSSVITTTADKLFLLSEIEVCGTRTYSFAGEGSQYAYYAAGNSKIKKANNSSANWWLRSPYSGGTLHFVNVSSNGSVTINGSANPLYVSFAFCV